MCPHTPPCPAADKSDRTAARAIFSHPMQGWTLLCNGVVIFEDTGELVPVIGNDGVDFETILPHRPTDIPATAAA